MNHTPGVTLVEVVLSLALGALILGSTGLIFKHGLDSWRFYNEHGELIQNSRLAIRRLLEELKYAESIHNSSIDIIEFDTVNLVDSDSEVERIRYNLLSGTLYRSVWQLDTENIYGASYIVAHAVSSFRTSFPAPGSQIQDGLVEVNLGLKSGSSTVILRGKAHLRNF
jgi:type II secretory pathway component PulJ